MPYFSTLGPDAGVRDILKLNRRAGRALVEFHEAVLRQPSPLTPGERELIAALVSGLNSCLRGAQPAACSGRLFAAARVARRPALTALPAQRRSLRHRAAPKC